MSNERRTLSLPPALFLAPAQDEEDVEAPPGQRRLPVEQGATFLPPPSPELAPPPRPERRALGAGGLTFSAPAQV